MIRESQVRQTAWIYFLCSYVTAFALWFQGAFYLQMLGWSMFFYNNYQIIYELYVNQHPNEN